MDAFFDSGGIKFPSKRFVRNNGATELLIVERQIDLVPKNVFVCVLEPWVYSTGNEFIFDDVSFRVRGGAA